MWIKQPAGFSSQRRLVSDFSLRKLILGVTLCQFKLPIPEATDLERLYWGLGTPGWGGGEGNNRDF